MARRAARNGVPYGKVKHFSDCTGRSVARRRLEDRVGIADTGEIGKRSAAFQVLSAET
jgi:hypothetical protein